MTDLEKLRIEHWSRVYAEIARRDSPMINGCVADEALEEFDKRFKPPCAHIFYAPITKCARCGEPMPKAMADDLARRPMLPTLRRS